MVLVDLQLVWKISMESKGKMATPLWCLTLQDPLKHVDLKDFSQMNLFTSTTLIFTERVQEKFFNGAGSLKIATIWYEFHERRRKGN